AEVPVDPTPRVIFNLGGSEFGVVAQRDRLGRNINKLLTYSPIGNTNTTVVRMDGTDHAFGREGRWLERNQQPGFGDQAPHAKNVWLCNNVLQVTQALSVVPSKQPVDVGGVQKRLLDTVLIGFLLENKDSRPHRVGFRIQVDTLIGGNDGVPF